MPFAADAGDGTDSAATPPGNVRWVRLATNRLRYMDRTETAAVGAWGLNYIEGLHGREELEEMFGPGELKALEAAAADAAGLEAAAAAAAMEDAEDVDSSSM